MELTTTLLETLQFLILISAIVCSIVYIHKDIRAYVSELKNDIDTQAKRNDRLYEMFVDLLKKGGK